MHGKCKSQFTEFSTKSIESYLKIFPKASFGNPHTLTDSRLLKIWSLAMLTHIILKPEMYLYLYFLLFQMWSMHTQRIISHASMHKNLKYFSITSLGISNEFVCEFCTWTFGSGGRVKNHICCLHVFKTFIIPKGKFW